MTKGRFKLWAYSYGLGEESVGRLTRSYDLMSLPTNRDGAQNKKYGNSLACIELSFQN